MSESEFVVTQSPPREQELIETPSPVEEDQTLLRQTSTAKKDVVDAIYEIENKGKSSKFMVGHISTDKLKDTFLIEEEQKYPDCDLNLNCKMHNRPAVFYSKQECEWKCYLCVLDDKGLIYLDK
jgi:hypothetical protein